MDLSFVASKHEKSSPPTVHRVHWVWVSRFSPLKKTWMNWSLESAMIVMLRHASSCFKLDGQDSGTARFALTPLVPIYLWCQLCIVSAMWVLSSETLCTLYTAFQNALHTTCRDESQTPLYATSTVWCTLMCDDVHALVHPWSFFTALQWRWKCSKMVQAAFAYDVVSRFCPVVFLLDIMSLNYHHMGCSDKIMVAFFAVCTGCCIEIVPVRRHLRAIQKNI